MVNGSTKLTKVIEELPQNEVYKLVSTGGFNGVCFVMFVASKTVINRLYISTYAIGQREIEIMNILQKKGKLKNVHVTISAMINSEKKSDLKRVLEKACKKNGWQYTIKQNHSKILLFDTEDGYFVLETSSNFNENPKIEQFSFEKDKQLFDFYLKNVFPECGEGI